MTSAHVRLCTLWGEEGNQVSARRGEEYVIFSWRKIVRRISVQPEFFLAGNRARNDVAVVTSLLMGACFQLFHSIMILRP